jgi:hypothetical protein
MLAVEMPSKFQVNESKKKHEPQVVGGDVDEAMQCQNDG